MSEALSEVVLKDRDYTVIVAKTAVSAFRSPPGFEDRWNEARSAILALARQCEAFDPDGITVYVSSSDLTPPFKHYGQVTSDHLSQVFDENYPPQALNLLDGLKTALDSYFDRKAAGQTKRNGEIIIVLIDGEPADRMAVAHAIVEATHKLDQPQELGIGFAQVGEDIIARGFLAALDENLRSTAGAKFDIVKTRVLETIEPETLTAFLLEILQG
ncbi:MAG TPA: hypothetical protein V6D18_00455 [Thermosynechococcaceae cyanobacterium]